MSTTAIYMKTGAGLAESSGKTSHLSPLDRSALARVDGKATPLAIADALFLELSHVSLILDSLEREGFIRPFLSPASSDSSSSSSSSFSSFSSSSSAHAGGEIDEPEDRERSESSLHDAQDGSVDGLDISALRSAANARSQGHAARLRQDHRAAHNPRSLAPLEDPSSDESTVNQAWDMAHAKAMDAAQARALRAREREKEEFERLQNALAAAEANAEREAAARAKAERELALAEQLRAQRERADREQAALELAERQRADIERLRLEEIDKAERLEAARIADVERARLRRLGVFKARARMAAYCLSALIVVAGALSLTRLIRVTPELCSRELSSWLGSPAEVSACEVSIFPSPSIIASGVLSKDGSIAVKRATLRLSVPSLAWGSKKIKSIALEDAKISPEGLIAAISARKIAPSQAGWLESVSFENATLSAGSFELSGLSGSGRFLSSGAFESARFFKENPAVTIEARLLKGAASLTMEAKIPADSAAGALGFEELSASGSLLAHSFEFDELSLRHPAGLLQARGSLSWANNEWRSSGPFDARALQANQLAPWLFLDGRASLSGDYTASGPTPEAMISNLSAKAAGRCEAALVKLDIAGAMGVSQTGSLSRFQTIDMGMSYANGALSVVDAKARSGSLAAQWSATRSARGLVNGSLTSSLASLNTGPMRFSLQGDSQKLSLKPER